MNGSIRRTTEHEGKQEEDAYPEEVGRAYAYGEESPRDGASDEPGMSDGDPELAALDDGNALKLPLRGDGVRTLVGLELPVYSTNMERVMELVGGLKSMQQTHEAKSQFLPVKLRPSEPSCKPLFADLTKTQTILLRLRRKRVPKEAVATMTTAKQAGEAPSDAKEPKKFRYEGEIVGLVREKYVCEGMADFQYFTARMFYPDSKVAMSYPSPVPVVPSSSSVGPAVPEPSSLPVGAVMPPSAVSTYAGSESQLAIKASLRPFLRVQQEAELEMIPEVFSKVDLPLKYEFRQRSGYQPTESAKKPSTTMTYLNFHDDTPAPAAPRPDNPVIRRRPMGSHENVDDEVLRILQEKLVQKPIWLRPKLFVGLDFMERRAARRILRKLCYVFVDGPWRGSWIRMGYDPRKTSDSAKYQVIELRNNRELVHAKVTHPTRKRTKKYSGINPKGPRIAKVTQTSEHESSQANKRRRKERFLRGETRRSYLVDPNEQQQQQQQSQQPASPDPSVVSNASTANQGGDNWYSDDDEPMDEDGKNTDEEKAGYVAGSFAGNASSNGGASANGDRTFEIFGVPLTSANVLFQLDEIDDEEVAAWISQFQTQEKPTLLGGWYSTHMFLPLREIIRYRIAALVGRSKAELETRRKRIEALKKQALSDYADQLAGREPSSSKKAKEKKRKANAQSASADTEEANDAGGQSAEQLDEADELAESLAVGRASQSQENSDQLAGNGDTESAEDRIADEEEEDEEEEEEEDDVYQDEDAAEVAAHGRIQKTTSQQGADEEDDEDEDEDDEEDEDEEQTKESESKPDSSKPAPAPTVEYSF